MRSVSIALFFLINMNLFGQGIDKQPVKEVLFKTLTAYELPMDVAYFAEKDQLEQVQKAVPKEVKLLDGKKVKIKGFMVPVKYNKDYKVTMFLFAPDQKSCCFGKIPKLNGFIFSTNDKGVGYMKDQLIEVTGTLTTIPKFYKSEECVIIYKMKVDSVKKMDAKGPAKGLGF